MSRSYNFRRKDKGEEKKGAAEEYRQSAEEAYKMIEADQQLKERLGQIYSEAKGLNDLFALDEKEARRLGVLMNRKNNNSNCNPSDLVQMVLDELDLARLLTKYALHDNESLRREYELLKHIMDEDENQ